MEFITRSSTLDPAIHAALDVARPAPSAGAGRHRECGQRPSAISDARGLLISIRDHLASLGLEPDIRGDEIIFEFLGHVHRLELEDLERRDGDVSEDERAMLACGLPIG